MLCKMITKNRFFMLFCVFMVCLRTSAQPAAVQAAADTSKTYHAARHQSAALNVLLGWSAGSVAVGAGQLVWAATPYGRAVGIQNVAWGLVDAGIAGYGKYELNQKILHQTFVPMAERKSFKNTLLLNFILDIGYIGAGVAMMRAQNPRWHPHGVGIAAQGGFLLLFDGINFAIAL
jgi:hypothetical protein